MSGLDFYLIGMAAMAVYAALFFGVGRRRTRDIPSSTWLVIAVSATFWPVTAVAAAYCCTVERRQ